MWVTHMYVECPKPDHSLVLLGGTGPVSPALRAAGRVLGILMQRKAAQAAFNEPWDPVEMELPSLRTVVTSPMDLNTVRARFSAGFYSSGTVTPAYVAA
jgi:hypothetical protein